MPVPMEVPKGSEIVAVTGASGYIASHVVQQLLEAGYTVRGTVRDPSNEKKTAFLKEIAAKANASDRLHLMKANLLDEGSFDAVVDGADYVLHMASPFLISGVSNPTKQLIEPAVHGTENLLNAVGKAASVKRVVLTSSCAAVYGFNDDKPEDEVFTEEDWNRTSTLENGAYSLSKRLAEEKAWEMAKAQDKYDLVTINPALVVGPTLTPSPGSSCEIMQKLVGGSMSTGAPNMPMGMVDVRDVATAHIVAMKNPNAKGRYIVSPETMSFVDMGKSLKPKWGQFYGVPTRALPKFLMYLIGPMVGLSWNTVSHNINHNITFSVEKAKKELGFEFRPIDKALDDMLESMIEKGMVRDKRK